MVERSTSNLQPSLARLVPLEKAPSDDMEDDSSRGSVYSAPERFTDWTFPNLTYINELYEAMR